MTCRSKGNFAPVFFMDIDIARLPEYDKSRFLKSGTCLVWRCHPDSNWGVELLQSSALPLGYGTILYRVCAFAGEYYLGKKRGKTSLPRFGASDEARTRYLHLGKVALYQMSYTRVLLPHRQTCGGMVPPVGIEPTTRGFSVLCSTN